MKLTIIFILSLLFFAPCVVTADDSNRCVCDCIYIKSEKIRHPGYYNGTESGDCKGIEGLACVEVHRTENYRGYLASCEPGRLHMVGSEETFSLSGVDGKSLKGLARDFIG